MPTENHVLVGGLLTIAVATFGCDEVRVDRNPSSGSSPATQSKSVESLVTPAGLGALVAAANPDGFPLEHGSRRRRIEGRDVTLGPVDQAIGVEEWATSVDASRLELSVRAQQPALTIPVRYRNPGDGSSRICRFRVTSDRWRIEFEAENLSASQWNLRRVAGPDFDAGEPVVESIGECGAWTDDEGVVAALRQALIDYLGRTVELGVETTLALSPYETLGLFRDRTTLEHLSPFPNRRGAVRLAETTSATGAVELDASGLHTSFDYGASARRADCAPPVPPTSPDDADIAPIQPGSLRVAGADAGLALAEPLIARLVQAATLGGFMCRGLDRDTQLAELSRQQIRPGDVGLADAPVAGPLQAVLSPGSLPEVDLRDDNQTVELSWDSWTLELYGEYAGTRVRLLRVTTAATMALQTASEVRDALSMQIRAVDIGDVSFTSAWATSSPSGGDLTRWTRRLLLLVFDETLALPLPLDPGTSAQLVQTNIRPDDVLLMFRFPTD